MKVGILTFHHAYNYGAYLQACALCSRLNQEASIEAEIIDYYMEKELTKYDFRYFRLKSKIHMLIDGSFSFYRDKSKAFARGQNCGFMLKSHDSLVSDSVEDFQSFVRDKYDVIIAGSDEIWKVNGFRGFPNAYWLPGNLGCIKMSYAASARVRFSEYLNGEQIEVLKRTIEDFSFVGVRDIKTKTEIDNVVGKEICQLCCDPSFLYTFEVPSINIADVLSKYKEFDQQKRSILLMVDDGVVSKKVFDTFSGEYNIISVFNYTPNCINVANITPIEWLTVIKNIDFVITSFFHATCYSIIYNTPFLSIGTEGKQSKLNELLSDGVMQSRYITTDSDSFSNIHSTVLENANTNGFSSFAETQRRLSRPFINRLNTYV
ncbi:MAG: polysaccharide pyruvyl transferase family protein [Oribacterium sp.]|nr:polysaccharide pyruvyl transferase family protein [Oribacterium sp.]MBQ5330775.1 polysaccharide pyruvyl transferase family protein [Oscillospiraceae bacterium]